MIIERTNYFALPGYAEDVLAARRRGTALRVALGLPPGRIVTKVSGPGPDVSWECAFDGPDALAADLAARDASPEFARQRTGMGTLLVRFERHVVALAPDQTAG